MTDAKKLEVYYHDSLVGYLAETPDHMIAFQYSDSWLRKRPHKSRYRCHVVQISLRKDFK